MTIVTASSCQILGVITVNDAKMIHAALLAMRINTLFCALFSSCGNKVTRYTEQNVRQAISRNANTQSAIVGICQPPSVLRSSEELSELLFSVFFLKSFLKRSDK